MTEPQTTPTQEREAAKKALARSIYQQIKALEFSLDEAQKNGISIKFSHHTYGGLPAFSSCHLISKTGNIVKEITKEIMQ